MSTTYIPTAKKVNPLSQKKLKIEKSLRKLSIFYYMSQEIHLGGFYLEVKIFKL